MTAVIGPQSATFTYDAKGNIATGNGLTIGYTLFDKPSSITRGTTTLTFYHDPEYNRFRKSSPTVTTHYLGGLAEKVSGGTTVQTAE